MQTTNKTTKPLPSTNNKSKDTKKAARKEAAEKALKTQQLLKSLKQDNDLLAPYPAFTTYNRNGINATLHYYTPQNLPEEYVNWVFDLTKQNVSKYYEACPGWGWNDKKKRRELTEDDARYIIVTTTDTTTPVAFLHFRFETERDMAVLYVYEVQVEESLQGKGMGKFLMKFVELIAKKSGLDALMLTVFSENKGARNLYKNALGYGVDEDSPGEEHGYEILIKKC